MLKYNMITEIGGVCIGWKTECFIKKWDAVFSHYQSFLTKKNPQITINVRENKFNSVKIEKVVFRTSRWTLGAIGNQWIVIFPQKRGYSFARINSSLTEVNFFIRDNVLVPLIYLLPNLLFCLISAKHKILILHACGIIDGRKGYIFPAVSGGGKSTIAKLAGKRTILNDDRIIIREEKKGFRMYGTPWHGEFEAISNKSIRLKEIFFIEKAKYNKIEPITKTAAIGRLFRNSFYLPLNNDIINYVLSTCFVIVNKLQCYRFSFKPDCLIWDFFKNRRTDEENTKKMEKAKD